MLDDQTPDALPRADAVHAIDLHDAYSASVMSAVERAGPAVVHIGGGTETEKGLLQLRESIASFDASDQRVLVVGYLATLSDRQRTSQ